MQHFRFRTFIRSLGIAALLTGTSLALLVAGCSQFSRTSSRPADIERSTTGQVDLPPPEPAPTSWSYDVAPAVPGGMQVVRRLKQVSFAKGSSSLDNEARGALGQAVEAVQQNSIWHLLIVGHADKFGEGANLGMSRANAVKSLLTSRGVDASRLHVQSLGSTYAQAGEFEKEGQKRDRKVEVWAFHP
jgi:outer membrane protein OmpA-like peptidoglycan-associated protein